MVVRAPAALLRCSCALWLAAAALAQNSTAATKPLADYRVCASARTPMVYCDAGLSAAQAGAPAGLGRPPLLSGFFPEVYGAAVTALGVAPAALRWVCLPSLPDAYSELAGSGAWGCDVVLAAPMDVYLLAEGVNFSRSAYDESFSILVPASYYAPSIWSWTEAFSPSLWGLLIATIFAAAFLTWAVDYLVLGEAQVSALGTNLYNSAGKAVGAASPKGGSVASHFVTISFCLLIMLVMNLYTSKTASMLTTRALKSSIRGYADLAGRAVIAAEGQVPALMRFGIQATGYPWQTYQDVFTMLDAMLAGAADAVVVETSMARWLAATNCSVAVVGGDFLWQSLTLGFPKGSANQELLLSLNQMLAALKATGGIEALYTLHAAAPTSQCSGPAQDSHFTIYDVAGLWVLLAVGAGVALATAAAVRLKRWLVARARAAHAGLTTREVLARHSLRTRALAGFVYLMSRIDSLHEEAEGADAGAGGGVVEKGRGPGDGCSKCGAT